MKQTTPESYIEEIPTPGMEMPTVTTATALFIGCAGAGPVGVPCLCSGFGDYLAAFGEDASLGELTDSVRLFFANGGSSCYVYRLAGPSPKREEYEQAFQVIDGSVDLFNLLILPRVYHVSAAAQPELWGTASRFCQRRRALLLMDPPLAWKTREDAINANSGVSSLRPGLVPENCALFFPRLLVDDNGISKGVGPSGALAGVMARMDAHFGVWKAPAGLAADIRVIIGLDVVLSDRDNGSLNRRGINMLRSFPSGVVNWGARTMINGDAGSEWRDIPVRRTALFIEESLYRGTLWAAFEPNDERLWSRIRRDAEAFMARLFGQGAFKGKNAKEAFFVKCDAATTTPSDRETGWVSFMVGFAPVRPAEFVVIFCRQKCGA